MPHAPGIMPAQIKKAEPTTTLSEYPKWMHHLAYPDRLVQDKEEEERLKREGWKTEFVLFNERRALEEEKKLHEEALKKIVEKLAVLDAQEAVAKAGATLRPVLQDKPSKEGK
jgi:G:T-mismatch repair DNA endonuclease (very short patch repair protein)